MARRRNTENTEGQEELNGTADYVQFVSRVPADTAKTLSLVASARGLTNTGLVNKIVLEYLDRIPQETKDRLVQLQAELEIV